MFFAAKTRWDSGEIVAEKNDISLCLIDHQQQQQDKTVLNLKNDIVSSFKNTHQLGKDFSKVCFTLFKVTKMQRLYKKNRAYKEHCIPSF